jgi:putative hydrolase of the HAD superfamily
MRVSVCTVFDIDDTLFLERDYVRSGFDAVGEWIARHIGHKDFGQRCWASFLAGKRGNIFDEALREGGQQPSAELIRALVEVSRGHTPRIWLAPDAADALKRLIGTGPIAVISDGPEICQSRKVAALGLALVATPIVLTDALGSGFGKPHPRAFEIVEQARPASAYLYVADNPLKDFAVPHQRGWITVRVRRPGGLHYTAESPGITPDYEMSDCSRLPELLQQF